jgi:hypothetical protein
MEYVFWWLMLAVPCFFVLYCNGADFEARLKSVHSQDDFWKFHKNLFIEGFHLLIYDYFGVYCPWSWEVAKQYRLADMRIYLGAGARHLAPLGRITLADCDNPEKQEEIARAAYISRTSHWARGAGNFLVAPIPGSLAIIALIIMGFADLVDRLIKRA